MKMRTWMLAVLAMAGTAGWLSAQGSFQGQSLPTLINSAADELVPRLSPDGRTLYFSRMSSAPGARTEGQDIYYTTRTGFGWTAPQPIGKVLNNQHHNIVGAVIEDGNALLLSNTYPAPGQPVKPGISKSIRMGEGWSQPVPVLWPEAFPEGSKFIDFCATADGKTLIVSRLRSSGEPEDLAVAFLQQDGTYTLPMSMGDALNSSTAYETAPYLSPDGATLYFTSNRAGGQGDGDIYVSRRLDDSWLHWSTPVNLGPEVNTAGFDGHFIVDGEGKTGYFISGTDPSAPGDIYEIALRDIPALQPLMAAAAEEGKDGLVSVDPTLPSDVVLQPGQVLLSGKVVDEMTRQGIAAQITILRNGRAIHHFETNADGSYRQVLDEVAGGTFGFEVRENYHFLLTESMEVAGKDGIKGQIRRNFTLTPLPMEEGQQFVLRNIYFDHASARLKPSSLAELARLSELMRYYPTLQISVNGHTDNVGDTNYNRQLSKLRAQAVVNYLRTHGVMSHRLSAEGYGEEKPIDTNQTDAGRAQNRRVEFTVTKR